MTRRTSTHRSSANPLNINTPPVATSRSRRRDLCGSQTLRVARPKRLEEFCAVLCENYGGWRWSILSRFWRILGVLVFGMSVSLFMSIWNGFGISGVMELQWINETKTSTVRFCYQNVDFAKFWKLMSKIMISNPKP